MLYRLTLLFLLIATPAFADPLKLDVPGIEGKTVSRKKAVSLAVIVTNKDSEDPVVFILVSVEKKGGDGKFLHFRTDIGCNCDMICYKHFTELKKSESIRLGWDFLGHNCREAPPGTYRFAITERYSEALSGPIYHGVSKEFRVVTSSWSGLDIKTWRETESARAVGAVSLTKESSFPASLSEGRKALIAALQEKGEDPAEFYATIESESERIIVHLWHRSAFYEENPGPGNPGGKCRDVILDPKTQQVRQILFWQ